MTLLQRGVLDRGLRHNHTGLYQHGRLDDYWVQRGPIRVGLFSRGGSPQLIAPRLGGKAPSEDGAFPLLEWCVYCYAA
jgi:hypothetical protein